MPDLATMVRLIPPLTTLAIIAYVLLRRHKDPAPGISLVILATLAAIAVS